MGPRNFALLGLGGFVAPRHLQAIAETGNNLIAAADPKDSVGVIDRYFPSAAFFTEFERFDRFLEKQRRAGEGQRAHWLSICSPNYLHDAHVRLAFRVGADAICEKPLVVNPWNLDQLAVLEEESGHRVFSILQLRLLGSLQTLKAELEGRTGGHDVELRYVTRRGPWYHASWKGDESKSGGLATNIGIHLFDMLLWLFGPAGASVVHQRERDRVAGTLDLARARIRWFLSVNGDDVPAQVRMDGKSAWRSMTIDGREIEFSDGFVGLHTRSYAAILAGQGFGISEARSAIELAHRIRTAPLAATDEALRVRGDSPR